MPRILAAARAVTDAIRTDTDRHCCVFAQRVLQKAFGLPPAEGDLVASWRIFDAERDASGPVVAADLVGVAESISVLPAVPDSPSPGRWVLCQGWRGRPGAPLVTGHTWSWRQVDETHGIRLDSAGVQFRPAPGPEVRGFLSWADQVRPYAGGVAVALLRQ